jgi:hypothetical protein
MATTNASNDKEHMSKLRSLAEEGMRVLLTEKLEKLVRDPAPRRHTSATQRHQNQPTAPANGLI